MIFPTNHNDFVVFKINPLFKIFFVTREIVWLRVTENFL